MTAEAFRNTNAGRDAHPAPARAHASSLALWFGLLAGPAAWTIQTLVNLPVVSHACYPRMVPLPQPIFGGAQATALTVSIGALLVCAAALVVSWRAWQRTRSEHQASTGRAEQHGQVAAVLETGEGRTRFMAYAGILTSVVFLLASIAHTVSLFVVAPCS